MPFQLSIYPWVHCSRYNDNQWKGEFIEHEHLSPEEEAQLGAEDDLLTRRNHIRGVPMVNFTSQYGLGCFEGLKAYPQKDGTLKLFRPEKNCARMAVSMSGLRMPPIPEDVLFSTIFEIVRRNKALGFTPKYDSAWEKDTWQNASTVYVRPFAISEPGIGVNLSSAPWVITICTTVSSYFILGENKAVVSKRIRATPGGTGWIKTAANYVTSALAKAEALSEGYMEAIFLDSTTGKNIEEGSSCNFFAVLKDGTIVTPELHDTILPGITRDSVMILARDMGMKTQERDLPLEEVFDNASECFVTGTAAGVTPLSTITSEGKTRRFASLEPESVSNRLLRELKSIQFGAIRGRHGWMKEV